MKVILAEHAGACYGVQRALDMAVEASAEGEGASTLGPLIHNPQVVADLAERGVRAVSGPEDVERGSVIIRSHGVTPAVRRMVEERGLPRSEGRRCARSPLRTRGGGGRGGPSGG